MSEPKRVAKQNKWGDSKRFYQIGDNQYPSVTTVLGVIGKPALLNWYAKMEREMVMKVAGELYQDAPAQPKMAPAAWTTTMQLRLSKEKAGQKELAKAAEIGSQVHSLIEWTLRASLMQQAGPSPRISDKAQWAFMAWEDWRRSVNLKPIFVEQVVWSNTYGYAGTLDLLAEVNGKLTVLDWKSGKAVYPEAHLQNAAYRTAIREMGHGNPVAGLIVRLPKVETDPDFEVVEALPENPCLDVFLHAQRVWTWCQEREVEREERTEQNLGEALTNSLQTRGEKGANAA